MSSDSGVAQLSVRVFWASVLLPLILLVAVLATRPVMVQPYEDKGFSDQTDYVLFATSIANGQIFEKRPINDIEWYRAVRTPGYPLLIVAATFGMTGDVANVFYLHLAMAAFTLVFLAWVFRSECPPIVTGGVVLCAHVLLVPRLYEAVLTEWSAYNVVLLILGLVYLCLKTQRTTYFIWLGLAAAFAALIRPSLLPLLVFAPLLWLWQRPFKWLEGFAVLATALPVVIWMAFNAYHLDSFSISGVRGIYLFGVGSQLGTVQAESTDSPELKSFIEHVNANKKPVPGQEDNHVRNLTPAYKATYGINMAFVAIPWGAQNGVGLIPLDREYMGVYGARAIAEFPANYAHYFSYGLKSFLSYGAPFLAIALLIIPVFCLRSGDNTNLAFAALVLFALHFVQAVLVAAIEGVGDRFMMLTFYPYLVAVLVCAVSLAFTRGWLAPLLSLLAQKTGRLAAIFSPMR